MHLYVRVCPAVCPSVLPSVRPSIHNAIVLNTQERVILPSEVEERERGGLKGLGGNDKKAGKG